jgi:hypothetical protein
MKNTNKAAVKQSFSGHLLMKAAGDCRFGRNAFLHVLYIITVLLFIAKG